MDNEDSFGISMAALGDLDCDGEEDLLVGARRDDGILNYSFAEVVYHILTT